MASERLFQVDPVAIRNHLEAGGGPLGEAVKTATYGQLCHIAEWVQNVPMSDELYTALDRAVVAAAELVLGVRNGEPQPQGSECPNCTRVHDVEDACFLGMLLGVVRDRMGGDELSGEQIKRVYDTVNVDALWDRYGGPAADMVQELIEGGD